jgi:glycopeptide antibiotics resistance protein
MCIQSAAVFLFDENSGRRIANSCSAEWGLRVPLFPKMYSYDWPEPLSAIFPLSQYTSKHTLFDPVINFLGFIPFGAIFFLFLQRPGRSLGKTFLWTMLIALVTSTGIELIQVLIPTRVSQIFDIVLNVFGASCGALSACIGQKLLPLANSDTMYNKGTVPK